MLDEQAFLILSLVNISILEAPFMKTKLLLLTIPVLLICACSKTSNNSSSTYSFPRETKPYRPSKEITEAEAATIIEKINSNKRGLAYDGYGYYANYFSFEERDYSLKNDITYFRSKTISSECFDNDASGQHVYEHYFHRASPVKNVGSYDSQLEYDDYIFMTDSAKDYGWIAYSNNFDPVRCAYTEHVVSEKYTPATVGMIGATINFALSDFADEMNKTYNNLELINTEEKENYSQTVSYSSRGDDSIRFTKTLTLKDGATTEEEDPLIESEIIVEFEYNGIKTYSEINKYQSGLCSTKKLNASYDEPDSATLPDYWQQLAEERTYRTSIKVDDRY